MEQGWLEVRQILDSFKSMTLGTVLCAKWHFMLFHQGQSKSGPKPLVLPPIMKITVSPRLYETRILCTPCQAVGRAS